jgi:fused signal recognition particle receptor
MFESLKKKLSSWIGAKEDKKTAKKTKVKPTVKKEKKVVKSKKSTTKTKANSKNLEVQTHQIPPQETEEVIEEPIVQEQQEESKGFFSKLFNKISTSELTQDQFDEFFNEFEIDLLENNVSLEVVEKMKESLSKELVGKSFKKADAEKSIIEALKKSISEVLIEPPNLIKLIKDKDGPFTIIFFGINGTGKTTSIAKLADMLTKNKISCVLAAADTFRAASIEQLSKHAENLKLPIIKFDYGSDPASVAFEAKKYAEKNNIKVVLIDTAGRMYTKQNLLKEMEKIIRISQPDLKIFVGESITGNDVIEQAKTFNEAIGIDGSILSKADVDDKAGAILSVGFTTKKPIYFLGVGQEYKDLEVFSKKRVLENLGL